MIRQMTYKQQNAVCTDSVQMINKAASGRQAAQLADHKTTLTVLCPGCSTMHEAIWTSLTKAENSLDMSVDKAHHKNMVNKASQFTKQNKRKTEE